MRQPCLLRIAFQSSNCRIIFMQEAEKQASTTKSCSKGRGTSIVAVRDLYLTFVIFLTPFLMTHNRYQLVETTAIKLTVTRDWQLARRCLISNPLNTAFRILIRTVLVWVGWIRIRTGNANSNPDREGPK
jgi:hypothetical protein